VIPSAAMRIAAIILIAMAVCSCSSVSKSFDEAVKATDNFHQQIAQADYGAIYDAGSNGFKEKSSRSQMIDFFKVAYGKLGACEKPNREGFRVNFNTNGRFVALTYASQCAHASMHESFIWRIEDGKAKLYGYRINSDIFKDDKKTP